MRCGLVRRGAAGMAERYPKPDARSDSAEHRRRGVFRLTTTPPVRGSRLHSMFIAVSSGGNHPTGGGNRQEFSPQVSLASFFVDMRPMFCHYSLARSFAMESVRFSPFDGMSATECREAIEAAGGGVRYFKAWPLVGRGGVRHDLLSHAAVESRMDKALHTSSWLKLRWLLGGRRWW